MVSSEVHARRDFEASRSISNHVIRLPTLRAWQIKHSPQYFTYSSCLAGKRRQQSKSCPRIRIHVPCMTTGASEAVGFALSENIVRTELITAIVPNGGYITGCLMEVVKTHFSTSLAKQNQPHTIAL